MKSFVGSIIAVVVGPALVYAGQAVLDNSGIIKTEILNVFNSLPTTGFVGMVVGAVKFFAYPAIVAGIAGAIAGVGRWLKNTGTDIKVV
jgi:hypothetical protein